MVPVDEDEEAEAEDQGPEAAEVVHADHDEAGEGRKRRRRGRRGGRRNRRGEGPVGEEAYPAHAGDDAPADEVNGVDLPAAESIPAIEPELATAIADFGGPAVTSPQPEEAVAHPAGDPMRRRSTVREAVTFPVESSGLSSSSPTPSEADVPAHVPEPAPEPASEASNKPRRTGWWAKRLLGGG
jgi:ribonuclease E